MKFVGVFLLMILFLKSYGQTEYKKINFVISIDQELMTNSLTNIHLNLMMKNGKKEKLIVNYIPGELIYDELKLEKYLSRGVDSIFLAFDYNQFCKNKHRIYNYEIPIFDTWLDLSYCVIYVYNLDKKKYKRVFDPLAEDRNYTYEVDYPGGSIRRIRKHRLRDKCN